MHLRHKQFVQLGLVIGLISISVVGLLMLWSTSHRRFDSNEWLQGAGHARKQHRSFMADDLVDSKFLLGKTQAEVVKLLGPPDREMRPAPAAPSTAIASKYAFVYELENDRMLTFDRILVVGFSQNDTAVDVRLIDTSH